MRVKVSVPASTSNLGPGFDALGLSLKLYNEFEVETADSYAVEVYGTDSEKIPTDDSNLFLRVYKSTSEYLGFSQPVKVKIKNDIPIGRGLGSSATAIVAGILAAQAVGSLKLSLDEVMDIALKFEPHPDNLLPALLGGFVIAATNGELSFLKLKFPKELKVVVVIPELLLSTEHSRSVLPESYSKKDVIFNIQRVALLLGALCKRDFHLLKEATRDKLHQPYRSDLIPGFWDVLSHAYSCGAYAAFLSGAGSCIAAFADKNFDKIGKSMCEVFESLGIEARYLILEVDENGAVFEKE